MKAQLRMQGGCPKSTVFRMVGAGSWLAIAITTGLHAIPEEFARDLIHDQFKDREAAQARYLEWARDGRETRIPDVFKAAKEHPEPEIRQRSRQVLFDLAMDDYLLEGEGFIGIQMVAVRVEIPEEEVNPEQPDVREVVAVTRVLKDTPAREADLRVGDMIESVDGVALNRNDALTAFQQTIKDMKPGTITQLGIIRGGKRNTIELKLGRRPPDDPRFLFGQPMQDLNDLAKQDQERFFKTWLQQLKP